jgi:hypothetical protein
MPLIAPALRPRFRFESHWVHMLGFFECVSDAWAKVVPANQNPYGVLHIKLSRTAKALRSGANPSYPM